MPNSMVGPRQPMGPFRPSFSEVIGDSNPAEDIELILKEEASPREALKKRQIERLWEVVNTPLIPSSGVPDEDTTFLQGAQNILSDLSSPLSLASLYGAGGLLGLGARAVAKKAGKEALGRGIKYLTAASGAAGAYPAGKSISEGRTPSGRDWAELLLGATDAASGQLIGRRLAGQNVVPKKIRDKVQDKIQDLLKTDGEMLDPSRRKISAELRPELCRYQ